MGEVFRARDTRLDREVAIKVLPQETSGDPERVARFHGPSNSIDRTGCRGPSPHLRCPYPALTPPHDAVTAETASVT